MTLTSHHHHWNALEAKGNTHNGQRHCKNPSKLQTVGEERPDSAVVNSSAPGPGLKTVLDPVTLWTFTTSWGPFPYPLGKKKQKNRKVYARWFPSRIEQKSNQSCSQALHHNAEETPWITKTALDGEPKLVFCLGHLLTISVSTLLPFVWEYDQTASEHSRGQPGSTLHIPVALVLHREGIATVSHTRQLRGRHYFRSNVVAQGGGGGGLHSMGT